MLYEWYTRRPTCQLEVLTPNQTTEHPHSVTNARQLAKRRRFSLQLLSRTNSPVLQRGRFFFFKSKPYAYSHIQRQTPVRIKYQNDKSTTEHSIRAIHPQPGIYAAVIDFALPCACDPAAVGGGSPRVRQWQRQPSPLSRPRTPLMATLPMPTPFQLIRSQLSERERR